MNRVGNKWTEEEEQRMVQGFQSGKSLEDIANDHQRTPKAIEMRRDHILRKLSTKASVAELAPMFHMETREVKDILASAPPPPTPKEHHLSSHPDMKQVLQRLENIETLMEKMYKRIKSQNTTREK